MKHGNQFFSVAIIVILSCNSPENVNTASNKEEGKTNSKFAEGGELTGRHFRGAFSNGMKGDSIYFDISADGKKLENLTFKGYWRCSGKLESTIAGPEGAFAITGGMVTGHISEPPNGGSTAWRFDLEADIKNKNASGTFRMNINNLGCDTYKLKWTATSD